MTSDREASLYDQYASTLAGAADLASAELIDQVAVLVRQAMKSSPRDQREVAEILGVSEARVSQVVNGDGNLRIGAIAKYLRALGYKATVVATAVEEGLPKLPYASVGRPKRRRGRDLAAPADSLDRQREKPYLYTFEAMTFTGTDSYTNPMSGADDTNQAPSIFFVAPVS